MRAPGSCHSASVIERSEPTARCQRASWRSSQLRRHEQKKHARLRFGYILSSLMRAFDECWWRRTGLCGEAFFCHSGAVVQIVAGDHQPALLARTRRLIRPKPCTTDISTSLVCEYARIDHGFKHAPWRYGPAQRRRVRVRPSLARCIRRRHCCDPRAWTRAPPERISSLMRA